MKCKYDQIYIICPKKYASGGPDALHQLSYYINRIGFKSVYMVYTDLKKGEEGLNPNYKLYNTKSVRISEIIDSERSLIVIPENLFRYSSLFKNANTSIWWLSVDNFNKKSIKYDFKQLLLSLICFDWESFFIYFKLIFFKNKKECNYFSASYYANDFLNKRGIKNYLLIEPISLEFLNEYKKSLNYKEGAERKKQILYNPKKGYELTKKIMQYNNHYTFIPLTGYSFKELIDLYKTSSLYIDFGSFPGAERMPKEAVLFGCNIVTGRHGASRYYKDVCIPDKWKFEDNQIIEICEAIRENVENYDDCRKDYVDYKRRVIELEEEFVNHLKLYFFD
ncbi:hypothetical protein [Streptococcus equinus]|uniref:hypothetical protein n=1 Tax=Streptococcus equinus TaxID=1335 RepID=UPI0005F78938|nr:hypothetical protein [Streptococcus equinus]